MKRKCLFAAVLSVVMLLCSLSMVYADETVSETPAESESFESESSELQKEEGVLSGEDERDIVASGSFDDITWVLTSDGTLTISGSGEINSSPWARSFAVPISKVVINKGITGIGDSAFYDCSSIKTAIISDSVTSIGEEAFYGCTALTTVTIPDSVTSIGDYAFQETGITSIRIPDSVTDLGDGICYECESLTEAVLGEGMTAIPSLAFGSCTALKKVTIPNSVTMISTNAFYGCISLTAIAIPNSVTTIKDNAFYGCTRLSSINIPKGMSVISDSAFAECNALTTLGGPGSGCAIEYDFPVTIPKNIMSGFPALSKVMIPDSVTGIGNNAFGGCNALKEITIPNTVTSIEDYAFSYCKVLESIKIPGSVTSFGYSVFSNCTALTNVTIPNSVTSLDHTFNGCTSLASVTIPDRVTSLDDTFKGCTSLASVTIPDSVTSLTRAFYGCTSLTSVTVPDSVKTVWGAFWGCTALRNVTLSENLEGIDFHTFRNCTALTSITIPDKARYIGEYAFSGCTSLASVKGAGKYLLQIGKYAFEKCTAIKKIEFSGGVNLIGDYAFIDCTSLEKIVLSRNVKTIPVGAFRNCPDTMTVDFYGTKKDWDAIEIKNYNDPLVNASKSFLKKPLSLLVFEYEDHGVKYEWNGREISPRPAAYLLDIGLEQPVIEGTDYTISYSYNASAGTATMTYTGIGEHYTGTVSMTFNVTVKPSDPVAVKSVSLNKTSAEIVAGKTETLTATVYPTNATNKKVTWKSSNTGIATVDANGKITAKKMGKVTITGTTEDGKKTATCSVRVLFTDVTNKNLVAYKAIYWGADNGYVNGYGTYFDINANCTRAQFVLFLWRCAGKPTPKSTTLKFKDSADIEKLAADYKKAILWGSENGIVAGFTSGANAGKFLPNQPCTRGQVVTFLWRYKGKPSPKSGAKAFPDVPSTNTYYKAIMWASSYGITTGFSDGTFRPNETCTRGQCVTFLYRLLA